MSIMLSRGKNGIFTVLYNFALLFGLTSLPWCRLNMSHQCECLASRMLAGIAIATGKIGQDIVR